MNDCHPLISWLRSAQGNSFDLARFLDPGVLRQGFDESAPDPAKGYTVVAPPNIASTKSIALSEGPPIDSTDSDFNPVSPPIIVERSRMKTIRRLEWAYHAANVADLVRTLVCPDSSSCHEANPIYGRDPDPLLLVGTKGAYSTALYFGIEELAEQDGGLAEAVGWFLTLAQSTVVGLNIRERW